MSAKKPTGQIGPVSVQMTPSGVTGGWNRIAFPTDKRDIENLIVRYFVNAMKAGSGTVLAIEPNDEADFDFTLALPGGQVYLELREVHYRDGAGRPYDSRQLRIQSFDYAQQIADAVHHKSGRYSAKGEIPIHLLLYITHWRFVPNEVVVRLAQYFLQIHPPMIENVFLVIPSDEKEAQLRVLYPSESPLEGRSVDEFRDHWYLNLDPASCRTMVQPPPIAMP